MRTESTEARATFVPTHVITINDERLYVKATPGADGRTLLYTEAQWNARSPADWFLDAADDELWCSGSAAARTPAGVATIETFDRCEWTRLDGWHDDGTRAAR